MGVLIPNYPEENVVKGDKVPNFKIGTPTSTSNVIQICRTYGSSSTREILNPECTDPVQLLRQVQQSSRKCQKHTKQPVRKQVWFKIFHLGGHQPVADLYRGAPPMHYCTVPTYQVLLPNMPYFARTSKGNVMHPQDHLLSCQLCPTFPPGWTEYGAIWFQVSIIL